MKGGQRQICENFLEFLFRSFLGIYDAERPKYNLPWEFYYPSCALTFIMSKKANFFECSKRLK